MLPGTPIPPVHGPRRCRRGLAQRGRKVEGANFPGACRRTRNTVRGPAGGLSCPHRVRTWGSGEVQALAARVCRSSVPFEQTLLPSPRRAAFATEPASLSTSPRETQVLGAGWRLAGLGRAASGVVPDASRGPSSVPGHLQAAPGLWPRSARPCTLGVGSPSSTPPMSCARPRSTSHSWRTTASASGKVGSPVLCVCTGTRGRAPGPLGTCES